MELSKSAKPISYLKSHMAKVLRDVSEGQRTMVIRQHGLALLKILAQSSKSIQAGRSKPVKKAFADIRKHIKNR